MLKLLAVKSECRILYIHVFHFKLYTCATSVQNHNTIPKLKLFTRFPGFVHDVLQVDC